VSADAAITAIVVKLPCWPSPVALPALFRLWRGKEGPACVPDVERRRELNESSTIFGSQDAPVAWGLDGARAA